MLSTARALLFTPGHRPDRFSKALASGPDLVILDLEDAVPADQKAAARSAISSWLNPDTPVAVRVNADGVSGFDEDLECAARPGVAAVVVPKTERLETIIAVARAVPVNVPIVPMIETAAGFDRALEIARHPRVQRLAFGTLDFQADLGIPGDDDALLYFRSQLVLVSRLAGIAAPIDGVTPRFDSPDPVTVDATRAKRFGFGGKLCIHPRQIPWVRTCFAPSAEEVTWARSIVDAMQAGDGAVAVDGVMVDRPVLERAKAILAAQASIQPPTG